MRFMIVLQNFLSHLVACRLVDGTQDNKKECQDNEDLFYYELKYHAVCSNGMRINLWNAFANMH